MKKNVEEFLQKHNQFNQTDNQFGLYKGIVVDNRDPAKHGRCRVHIYNLHTDYKGLPITTLPWAEPLIPFDGSFPPPSRFARVWVLYEGGDQTTPVYFGRWYGIPTGRGKLPFNSGVGAEQRPEAWDVCDLVPEALLLGSTSEGSAIWFNELLLGEEKGVASSINIMDTGSKYFKITSLHLEKEPWVKKELRVAEVNKSLEDVTQSEQLKPIRDGFSEPVESAGSIEMGFKNLTFSLATSKENKTSIELIQSSEEEEAIAALAALDGQIFALKQDNSQISLMDEAIFAGAQWGLLASSINTSPTRWD